jgi:hypothetical protein
MRKLGILAIIMMFCSTLASGHVVPVKEIVEYLNSKQVREEAGIERATQDEKLPRLLVIEVNDTWFKLSETNRRNFAKKWYTIWRHTVSNGIVSVIDKDKGEPVVHFFPDGRIALTR